MALQIKYAQTRNFQQVMQETNLEQLTPMDRH
jgi:hypothetical protein